jgi:hypothetical protein
LNLLCHLVQHEGRSPAWNPIGGEVAYLHLHLAPPDHHGGQVRSERHQQATEKGIAEPLDHRATPVIEQIPRQQHESHPERVCVTQQGKTEASAGADEPGRARPLPSEDVCQPGGGAKEYGGNVGACVANAAQKVAVERKKQRR